MTDKAKADRTPQGGEERIFAETRAPFGYFSLTGPVLIAAFLDDLAELREGIHRSKSKEESLANLTEVEIRWFRWARQEAATAVAAAKEVGASMRENARRHFETTRAHAARAIARFLARFRRSADGARAPFTRDATLAAAE